VRGRIAYVLANTFGLELFKLDDKGADSASCIECGVNFNFKDTSPNSDMKRAFTKHLDGENHQIVLLLNEAQRFAKVKNYAYAEARLKQLLRESGVDRSVPLTEYKSCRLSVKFKACLFLALLHRYVPEMKNDEKSELNAKRAESFLKRLKPSEKQDALNEIAAMFSLSDETINTFIHTGKINEPGCDPVPLQGKLPIMSKSRRKVDVDSSALRPLADADHRSTPQFNAVVCDPAPLHSESEIVVLPTISELLSKVNVGSFTLRPLTGIDHGCTAQSNESECDPVSLHSEREIVGLPTISELLSKVDVGSFILRPWTDADTCSTKLPSPMYVQNR
jgi:hypothetical protein